MPLRGLHTCDVGETCMHRCSPLQSPILEGKAVSSVSLMARSRLAAPDAPAVHTDVPRQSRDTEDLEE